MYSATLHQIRGHHATYKKSNQARADLSLVLSIFLKGGTSFEAHSVAHQGKALLLFYLDSLLRHNKVHSTGNKDNQALELDLSSIDAYTRTNQMLEASHSVSLENDINRIPSLQAQAATPISLSSNQHDSVPLAQGRLPGWLENIIQSPMNNSDQHGSQAPLFTSLEGMFDSSMDETLNFSQYSQIPTWLADEHFDLSALNSSVMASTLGIFSPGDTAHQNGTDINVQPPAETLEHKEDEIRQLWFTWNSMSNTGRACPKDFNNAYQQNLYHLPIFFLGEFCFLNDSRKFSDAYTHGQWARFYKMFQVGPSTGSMSGLQAHNVERPWRAWVQAEEQIRLAAGLFILDTEISELVSTHPLLQHDESLLPITTSDELWVAPNATQWKNIMTRQLAERQAEIAVVKAVDTTTSPPEVGLGLPGGFYRYTLLEGINARITERRTSQVTWDQEIHVKFENELLQFFDQNLLAKLEKNHDDPFCLEVLWHAAFISLLVDFDRLELTIGREGHEGSLPHRDHIHEWASSPNARRCALHGAMILRKLQGIPLGMEPAIHVPRALYRAATVWYAYSEYGLEDDASLQYPSSTSSLEIPEFARLKINSQALLFEAHGFRNSKPKTSESSTLCGLVDLLHRIGHWGLSRKFAEQLSFLLKETPN
ncbi:hypothetical protein N7462_003844 [Penicillium macrosclerotiorum]|uniref:uncharacterized protein n=1 Tax=Penicillium macrosclerotiorum TaxID=303699 RepID=UPI0025466EAC|nr:uncharacterized protein N7462_003844 [Penicillium macrosclerotiorum]KAJ5689452.1 hypothetical protein N7462_003844 [Penicillium macrosclerotiorum]